MRPAPTSTWSTYRSRSVPTRRCAVQGRHVHARITRSACPSRLPPLRFSVPIHPIWAEAESLLRRPFEAVSLGFPILRMAGAQERTPHVTGLRVSLLSAVVSGARLRTRQRLLAVLSVRYQRLGKEDGATFSAVLAHFCKPPR